MAEYRSQFATLCPTNPAPHAATHTRTLQLPVLFSARTPAAVLSVAQALPTLRDRSRQTGRLPQISIRSLFGISAAEHH